jgi:hypothetical protein
MNWCSLDIGMPLTWPSVRNVMIFSKTSHTQECAPFSSLQYQSKNIKWSFYSSQVIITFRNKLVQIIMRLCHTMIRVCISHSNYKKTSIISDVTMWILLRYILTIKKNLLPPLLRQMIPDEGNGKFPLKGQYILLDSKRHIPEHSDPINIH